MGEAGAFAFWLAVGFASLGVTFGPLGHAIARWLDSRGGRSSGGNIRVAVERLENRLAELEGVEHRLLEVEERLDFTERMLAAGRTPTRLDVDTPPEPADTAR